MMMKNVFLMNKMRFGIWLNIVICLVGALLLANPAAAQDRLSGWCIPDDGCMGLMRITGNEFDSCDSICRLTKPVQVRGLDAILYDVECKGDWGKRSNRMMFLWYDDVVSKTKRILVIDQHFGSRALQKC
jgi:hypothetical protein